jgi:hypothetical protein
MLLTKATADVNQQKTNQKAYEMKGDHTSCLTHPKTGNLICRQPAIMIDAGQAIGIVAA